MRKVRALWLRLRGIFGASQKDGDFAAELESHLAMHIEDGMRAGLTRDEARRQALIRLGGLEQTKIAHRERRGLPFLESLARDVAYGVRVLKKNPGFALVAILIIAVGIGANAALFTVVRSVLLRPLPFADPDRLVMLYGQNDRKDPNSTNVVAAGDFYAWQQGSHGFEQMALWRWSGYNLSGDAGDLPEFVNAVYGSWNIFSTFGVQPVLGRSFTPDDDRHGATRTVIIGWNLFKRRFNGDPAIVGKTIRLNSLPYTVVGVLPKSFTYPDPEVQAWVPYRLDENPQNVESHFNHMGHVIARLKRGVTIEQATQEASGIQYQLFLHYNNSGPIAAGVVSQPLVNDVAGCQNTALRPDGGGWMPAADCLLEPFESPRRACCCTSQGDRDSDSARQQPDAAVPRTTDRKLLDLRNGRCARRGIGFLGHALADDEMGGYASRRSRAS
jgi:MacB-like periplasmic core domain